MVGQWRASTVADSYLPAELLPQPTRIFDSAFLLRLPKELLVKVRDTVQIGRMRVLNILKDRGH